jgi:hypothetical protein
MSRLQIIPDETLAPLALQLRTRLKAIVGDLRWEHLIDLSSAEGVFLLGLVNNLGGTREMQLWGKSASSFVMVWTSRGTNDSCIGTVTAELGRGLVNQVFESHRPEVKEGGFLDCSDWTNLESRRGLKVDRMAAHPVTIFGRCLGVLSLSRFEAGGIAGESDESDMKITCQGALLLARLIEDRLTRACLGFAQG